MTILTSSFYAILQYYNNHHAHIEHTHYNIEQKFCQVFIRKQFSLTTVTQFLKAKEVSHTFYVQTSPLKKRFLLHFGTNHF